MSLKMILHKLRVVWGGGHRVCIERGCDSYHGITAREGLLFVVAKNDEAIRQGFQQGLESKAR